MTNVYQDWAAWLEGFARGDEPGMVNLSPITFDDMHPSVVIGLRDRVAASFDQRFQIWQRTLSRDLGGALDSYGLAALEPALTRARFALGPLRELTENQLLPHEWRSDLSRILHDGIGIVQRDLERSARGPQARRIHDIISRGSLLHALGGGSDG